MRIVSLLPSATEVVFELGIARKLVGVSHDSDWPVEATSRRIVTRPFTYRGGRAGEAGEPETAVDMSEDHDRAGSRRAPEERVTFELDEAALAEVRPDLVIGPPWHDIVAPVSGSLDEAIRGLGREVALLSLDPTSVEGILHSVSTVGAMTGAEAAALRVVERLRARLGRLERLVQRRRDEGRHPTRVVALEWLDPPLAAGRWVPEQVRRAGGWELLGREGERPAETSWEAVREVDPETIVLMPRGRHLDGALADWAATTRPSFWQELDAVRRGQVFVVDGASYFSRPGPRFVDGIALLAEVLDPDGLVETSPIGTWTPVD
jgi:iron complex transport system substrate-binding protein